MRQLITYLRYFFEYLKHGDINSIIASVQYVLFNTSHKNDRIIRTSIGTFFCRNNTNDFQFANLAYEWGVKRFILKRKKEFSVFIDVGSCIGDYCILLAKMDKRCFAFEPVSDNIKTLMKNLRLNELQNTVRIIPFGLGEYNYQTSYKFDPVNTGASRVYKDKRPGENKAEIRRLDDLMPSLGIVPEEAIFMKIDIEGMETEALRGAMEFIRFYPQITLIIEDYHSGQFPITDTLNEIAVFEFGKVDKFNMYAKKLRNY